MTIRRLTAVIALFFAVSCSHAKQYELRGQVLAVNRDKQELLVKHEEIVGYMMAMTMPYKVQSAGMLDNVAAGDIITAQLEVKDNLGTITALTKTGTAPPDVPKPSPLADGIVMLIKEGEAAPDAPVVDQDGKPRRLAEIRDGHALALTFMYTKCPMPTYCPMMDRNFVEVQKQIKASPALRDKARLLSVSFDPKNDTPPVLKQHAKKLGADPSLWTFATGTQDDIDKLAMSFGVTLVRGASPNPDEIGHTLRTAIIDRDGKVVKIYTGNEWTPAQIIADLQQLR
jgi:protein SCO1/2